MTDKQIIIDGINVVGCEDYGYRRKAGYWCHNYDEPCTDYQNCNYKQLKRKEQECEELQNKFLELNSKAYSNSLELDQLKSELEQEKALKETYLTCYKAKHEDIEGELFKLKQTLTAIKEIAKAQIPYLNIGTSKTMIEIEYDYAGAICNLKQRMSKILQKISECEAKDD